MGNMVNTGPGMGMGMGMGSMGMGMGVEMVPAWAYKQQQQQMRDQALRAEVDTQRILRMATAQILERSPFF